ncbi:MAG TPA: CinA family protein [Devosia sp.]|nr:CinA family protein [Devosia sp.]
MKMPPAIAAAAQAANDLLREQKLTVATAESCTGGLVAGALTSIPGSSDVVTGGFITYANAAKIEMIGVPARLIRDFGAVSPQVARSMADGARNTAGVDVAVAITGIAGPGGGSAAKPVGLVYFACATHEGTRVLERRFGDLGRDGIREASVLTALELLIDVVTDGVSAAAPDPAA